MLYLSFESKVELVVEDQRDPEWTKPQFDVEVDEVDEAEESIKKFPSEIFSSLSSARLIAFSAIFIVDGLMTDGWL